MTGRRSGDQGSATLELVILTPAVLVLLGLAIAAGRIEIAGGEVEQAAAAAAREASIARTELTARTAATETARGSLQNQGVTCGVLEVVVDSAGFGVTVGVPAQVQVGVACTVELSDLAVPGMPGTRTLRARVASPLDRYRSRASGFTNSEGLSGANSGVG
jgi:Flp pilus assembly protein TadG